MGDINWGDTGKDAAMGAGMGAGFGPWGAAIGGVIGAAAGIVGSLLQSGDEEKIQRLQQQALQLYGDISLPSLTKVVAQSIQPTQVDPSLKNAQKAALDQLLVRSKANGMDPQSQAAYMQAQQQSNQDNVSRQKSIEEQMARRGASGSGAEWAARAGSASSAADRLSRASYQAAGDSASRGLQATQAASGAATAGRGQDDQEAQAANAIKMYNQQMQFQAAQGDFQNQLRLADAKARAMGVAVGGYERSEGRTADTAAAIGKGAGALAQVGMYAYNKGNNSGVPQTNVDYSATVPGQPNPYQPMSPGFDWSK
jgi:hypothetical protein